MDVLSVVVLWMLSAIVALNGECVIAGARIGGQQSLGPALKGTSYPTGDPNQPCVSLCKSKNKEATSKGDDGYRCTKWSRVTTSTDNTLVNCASYSSTSGLPIKISANGGYAAGVLGSCSDLSGETIEMAKPDCFERKRYNAKHITYLGHGESIKGLEPQVPVTCQKMCDDHAKANPNNGCTHVSYFGFFNSMAVAINAYCFYYKIKNPNVPLPADASSAISATDKEPNQWSGPARCPKHLRYQRYVTFKV